MTTTAKRDQAQHWLAATQCFFGEATAVQARVYAEAPGAVEWAAWRLEGEVVGPFCDYAQTLPFSTPLIDQGPGATRLLGAVLPDPCFWTPETPFLYRVRLWVERDGERIATAEHTLGIRPFGVRGDSFFLDGQRWVPRGLIGVERDARPLLLEACRATSTALAAPSPTDALLHGAARQGTFLFAMLPDDAACIASELARLGQCPAVGAAWLVEAPTPELRRAWPKNLRVGEWRRNLARRSGEISTGWGEFVVIDAEEVESIAKLAAGETRPVVALLRDRSTASNDIVAARAACDRLQAKLAALGVRCAGYFVGPAESAP